MQGPLARLGAMRLAVVRLVAVVRPGAVVLLGVARRREQKALAVDWLGLAEQEQREDQDSLGLGWVMDYPAGGPRARPDWRQD